MRHAVLVTLIGAALGSWCSAAEPVAIVNVSTLEELKAVEPVKIKDWTVKLGLGDSGRDGGPWVVLYCLAEYAGKGEKAVMEFPPDVRGERLGPVFWTTRPEDRADKEKLAQEMVALREAGKRRLYAAVVSTAWKGQFPLRVLDGEGKTIARTELVIHEPRRCHWHTFAELTREPGEKDDVRFGYRVARESVAAIPKLPEFMPILPEAGWEVKVEPREKRAEENLLPGAVPLHRAWAEVYGGKVDAVKEGEEYHALELTFDGKVFVVDARQKKLNDWGERHLLARWWVNGEPVAARPRQEQRKLQAARQVRATTKLSVDFGVPAPLGALRGGDKVALQVMYVPDGYEELDDHPHQREMRMQRQISDGQPLVPILSNRVEWAMSKELIGAARP